MIIETHLHLCDEKFDADRDEVLNRAKEAGVAKILNVGAELSEVRRIAGLNLPDVFKSLGLHPENAGEFSGDVLAEIKEYLKDERVRAVGEIGLDYHKNTVPKETQEKMFRKFIEAAVEFDLPVVIHSRDAHDDVYRILKEYNVKKRGIIHCFSGSFNMAGKFTDAGYALGIGGVLTFSNAADLREVIRKIPLESLVLETDAPWLAPQKVRGKRNESANLKEIAEKLAEVKGISVEKVEEVTSRTAQRVLGI
jgi:TatD DNase family protein